MSQGYKDLTGANPLAPQTEKPLCKELLIDIESALSEKATLRARSLKADQKISDAVDALSQITGFIDKVPKQGIAFTDGKLIATTSGLTKILAVEVVKMPVVFYQLEV